MTYFDVGKNAKHMGRVRPRDGRKVDPVPEKAPPGNATAKKGRKLYGFSFRKRWADGTGKWRKVPHWAWYATAKQRDDAMRTLRKCRASLYEMRDFEPLYRGTQPESETAP